MRGVIAGGRFHDGALLLLHFTVNSIVELMIPKQSTSYWKYFFSPRCCHKFP